MYEAVDTWLRRRSWHVQALDIGEGLIGRSCRQIRTDTRSCSIFMLESDDTSVAEQTILPDCDSMLEAQAGGSPWSTLRWINARLHRNGDDVSATACLGVCTASGLVRIAFAGYPCAYVQAAGGRVRRLAGGGAPLGLFPDVQYPEKVCVLEEGEAVMFLNPSAERLLERRDMSPEELFAAERFGNASLPMAASQGANAIVVRRLDPAFRFAKEMRTHAVAQL